MSKKLGYDGIEEFKEKAQKKFSLVDTGVVERGSTRLLLINVRLWPLSLSLPSPGQGAYH